MPVRPELLICDLGSTHRLLFNKFNVYQNHLLVITRHYESQMARLTPLDLHHSALACQALSGIAFFNGGLKSGASQSHKHMQVLPEEAKQLPIFNSISKWVEESKLSLPEGEVVHFPLFKFKHGLIVLRETGMPLGQQW